MDVDFSLQMELSKVQRQPHMYIKQDEVVKMFVKMKYEDGCKDEV